MLKMNDKYMAAGYVRLSREDGDKEESDSIINQRQLISDFAARQNITLYDIYVDDGYSGTNFQRPGFLRMVKDIEAGKVDCVIVKDLSRFGRDYIDTGKYLERIFPEMGVRFVSISDGIDSVGQYDMLLPIRNIFNEQYARDISKKVHAAMNTKQKSGAFIGAFASYGYNKSPLDKNKLVIDPYAAGVVQRIYDLYLSGVGQIKIAAILNEEGILCPSEYKRINGENYHNSNRAEKTIYWTYSTVHKILQNRIYTGDMVQGKTIRNMRKKAKYQSPEDWIIVPNTHEAIIERDKWNRVQEYLKIRTRGLDFNIDESAFSGLIKCGDCGTAMVKSSNTVGGKKYVRYSCGAYKRSGRSFCTSHSVPYKVLEKIVLNDFRTVLSQIENIADIVEKERLKSKKKDMPKRQLVNKQKIENELIRIRKLKQACYEDYRDGILTREEFMRYKEDYSAKEKILETQMKEKDSIPLQEKDIYQIPWIKQLLELKSVETITRDISVEMIEKIEVFEDKRIKITYKFSKDLGNLLDMVTS